MRFKSIWFMPSFSFTERLIRTRDWAAMKIAAALPLRVRYWATILEVGHATIDSPNVPATKLEDILQNMRAPKVMR